MPWDALTTYVAPHNNIKYCLQPKACDGDDAVICTTCLNKLRIGKVPKDSFVNVDTGSIPEGLVPLTMVEANLVARNHTCRNVFVIKPPNIPHLPADQCRKGLRGHVISFPNVPLGDVQAVFPLPLERIPEIMQVSEHICILHIDAISKTKFASIN